MSTTQFWVMAWLSFTSMLVSEVNGSSSVSGNLNVRRSLHSQIECDTQSTATLNAHFSIRSEISTQTDAHSTHLSARHVIDSEVDCSSHLDVFLSRVLTLLSSIECESAVRGRVTVNPVDIDSLLVTGETAVTGELNRLYNLSSDIGCETSVDANIECERGLLVDVECSGAVDADLNRWASVPALFDSTTDCSGHITVNTVEIEAQAEDSASVSTADLNATFSVVSVVTGETDVDASADVTHSHRMSGDTIECSSSCEGILNRESAHWSLIQPKSIVSGYLNAAWSLHGTLTVSPLSNTTLYVHLSARFETSVTIDAPRSIVSASLGKKHGVWSDIAGESQCTGKITLNPVWITGLLVDGYSVVDADLGRNRSISSLITGSSSVGSFLNKYGACWTTPNPKTLCSAYLNKYGACWTRPDAGRSACSGLLSKYHAISAYVSCGSSLNVDAWRMRNLDVVVDESATVVTGHVTVNPRWIVDAASDQHSSDLTADLGVARAVHSAIYGSTDVDGEAWRKRNVYGVSEPKSIVTGLLNRKIAIRSQPVPGSFLNVHLSRRFYTSGDPFLCSTSIFVYLSAIRPITGLSLDGHSSIDATAWRMRNIVPDLILGAWEVTGRLTINGVLIDGESSGSSSVSGEIFRIFSLKADAVTGVQVNTAELNRYAAIYGSVQSSCDLGGVLNGEFACPVEVSCDCDLAGQLNVARSVESEVSGTCDVEAVLLRERALYSEPEGSTALTGKLSVNSVPIDGTCTTDTHVEATLNLHMAVEGSSSGQTDLDVEAFRKRNVGASVSGDTDLTATLNRAASITATASGESDLTASLAASRAMLGSSVGDSHMTSTLNAHYAVLGTSQSDSDLIGDLTFLRELWGYAPTETVVEANLVKNIRELWAVSDGCVSLASAELQKYLQFIAFVLGTSQVSADFSATFALWGDLYPYSVVTPLFNARFALSSDVSQSRSQVSANLSALKSVRADVSGDTDLTGSLGVEYSVQASVYGECVVSGELTINAKELESEILCSSQVSGDIERLRVLVAHITGESALDVTLSAEFDLRSDVYPASDVVSSLNAERACVAQLTCSSDVSGRLDKMRSVSTIVVGETSVLAHISITVYPTVSIEPDTDLVATLSREISLMTVIRGITSVGGVFGIRGELFGGDAFAQFTSTGGRYVALLVRDTPGFSLPDWADVGRTSYALLSALVEGLHLSISPDLVSDLASATMSPVHHVSVWQASVSTEPQTVLYQSGPSGASAPIRRVQSMYELVHSPVPVWYWQDGVLYVSRLAMAMESVVISGNEFQVARPVSVDGRFPVYLVWSRPRGDLFYLLDDHQLQFQSGKLVKVAPRFGYIIGFSALQLGAEFDVYTVSAKAHPWLTFQSSSGGDSLPTCAPAVITLSKRGFVSVQIHQDTVRLDRARGERIYRNAEGSLSPCAGLRGQLVGVFVGDSPPSSVPGAISSGNYGPAIGQVFPIEPGSRYIVPSGATRLVLGVLHDGSYSAGSGSFIVSVTEYDTDGSLSVVYTDPYALDAQKTLLVDGNSVTVRAANVATNLFYQWFRRLGGELLFAGWSGSDLVPYLHIVGLNAPVIPGIKPSVYRWDGVSPLSVSGYRADVLGVPDSVTVRFRMPGNVVPYPIDERMLVNGRWDLSASMGDEVHARLRLWRAQTVAPGQITISSYQGMRALSGGFTVVSLPYEVRSAGAGLTRAGAAQNAVFVWDDDVS